MLCCTCFSKLRAHRKVEGARGVCLGDSSEEAPWGWMRGEWVVLMEEMMKKKEGED